MNNLQTQYTTLKTLQRKHSDLQQTLNQQIHLLHLNLNILKSYPQSNLHTTNQQLINNLIASQAQLSFSFTEQLLNNQVQLQQQSEMAEIIKCYERRISELRAHLINKQAEINYWTQDSTIQLPFTRQNMQLLNIETLQRQTIRKNLIEYKKISVELEALQHTLKIYSSQKTKDSKKPTQTLKSKEISEQSCQKQVTLSKSVTAAQQKSNHSRMQLLDQILNIFKEELQRQQLQKQQLAYLKSEWNNVSNNHKQLIKQYQNAHTNKTHTTQFSNDNIKTKQNCKKPFSFLSLLEQKGEQQLTQKEPLTENESNLKESATRPFSKHRNLYLTHKSQKKQNSGYLVA